MAEIMRRIISCSILATSAAAGLLACGCGGSSSSGGTAPVRLAIADASYSGVYRTDATSSSHGSAGTVQLNIGDDNGVQLTLGSIDGSSQLNFTGILSGNKATITNNAGASIALTLTPHSSTPALTGTYTASAGTRGHLTVGLSDTVTAPLAVNYAGSYSSTGGESGTLAVIIDSDTLEGTGTASSGTTFPIAGYFDNPARFTWPITTARATKTALALQDTTTRKTS